MNAPNLSTDDDSRIMEVLDAYAAELDAGKLPDREPYLRKYPELETQLTDYLEGLDVLYQSLPRSLPDEIEQPTLAGTPLGDFQLKREIGRGGMGIVYEGYQLSLGRRVAIKILPFTATLEPRQLQRFKNEAQAAACLHHPNIVPVFAVGCERGVHFYAMQYIEGQNAAVAIAETHQQLGLLTDGEEEPQAPSLSAETEPVGWLSTELSRDPANNSRHVASLGIQAAEALHYAHELSIVHRDIKPANLLIDQHGKLWITDFGLAQVRFSPGITDNGAVLGTLRYMSPEQALAKREVIDHRTDIYGLGATLYELATLQPVFSGTDREELLKQITLNEPKPPRRINPAIPVDLETILLKALAKEPSQRYATAQEFAADLHRFLAHKPILAKKPSPVSHLAKWAWRHRIMVACSLLLLVLATVGLAVSNVLLGIEQAKTRRAFQAEAEQRLRAEENFEQARRMLDQFAKISDEELASFRETAHVRRKLLEAALGYYEDFLAKSEDPRVRATLSRNYIRLGKTLQEVGEQENALAAFEKARQSLERLARSFPRVKSFRKRLASVYRHMGMLRTHSQIRLLLQAPVQKELKLVPAQTMKIALIADRLADHLSGLTDHVGQSDLWRRFDELTENIGAEIAGLLTKRQLKRLEQISLQQQRSRAFRDPSILTALDCNDTQRRQIKSILDRSMFFRGPWQKRPRENTVDSILAFLSEEQRAVWQNMIGPPLAMKPLVGTFREHVEFAFPRRPRKKRD